MIVLEGIAVTGDPEFDLFTSAYPYAFKRAISLFGLGNLSEIAKEAAKNNELFKNYKFWNNTSQILLTWIEINRYDIKLRFEKSYEPTW